MKSTIIRRKTIVEDSQKFIIKKTETLKYDLPDPVFIRKNRQSISSFNDDKKSQLENMRKRSEENSKNAARQRRRLEV